MEDCFRFLFAIKMRVEWFARVILSSIVDGQAL